MVDFIGSLSRTIKSGAFPDPDVGTPVLPSAADQPYPPGPFDPIGASPSIVPFERVGTFDLLALGVNVNDPNTVGPAQSGSVVAGPSQSIGAQNPLISDNVGVISRGIQFDWFEKWYVFPGELDLGNVLSSQSRDLEVFSTFRSEDRTWVAFTNNASLGVTVTGLPALPTIFAPLESTTLQVNISTQGTPTISGTLDFLFDTGLSVVPLTGTRVVLFPYEPQTPMKESLEFLTDLLVSADGTEQRISLRNGPRQVIEMIIRDGPDVERDALNALLYDWHARLFGVPIWWEARNLDADIAIGSDTILVNTQYADYRLGSLVAVGTTYDTFETFEIIDITLSSIQVQGQFEVAHAAPETLVTPVRLAYAESNISQSRFLTGLEDTTLRFTTIDNINLADASAFGTYNSKVLIDQLNKVSGRTVREGYNRLIERMDAGTGRLEQRSLWAKSKPAFNLGLNGRSMQETWEIRQLMHSLAGRRVSFYLGTGRSDLKPLADIADSATQIDIEYINFTSYYEQVTPRSDLQIIRTDGTMSQHSITGSSVVVADVQERLTISPSISPALPLQDLERIEFLTLSRLDSDKISIEHVRAGVSDFRVPTMGTLV